MLIFLTIMAVWFALGFAMAPRAAAYGYRHCPYSGEKMRRASANEWYWFCRFIGPIVVICMFNGAALRRMKRRGKSSVEKALVRHDPRFREGYLKEQESRIARLERENARLTKDVLT